MDLNENKGSILEHSLIRDSAVCNRETLKDSGKTIAPRDNCVFTHKTTVKALQRNVPAKSDQLKVIHITH